MFDLSTLLQWLCLREKVRWVPRATQPGCEVESGAFFFLKSSEYVQLCWVSVNGCHVHGLLVESILVDWRKKRTCHVYQVSPTGCISIRIIVTLGYE
jgi:hypothetical protein